MVFVEGRLVYSPNAIHMMNDGENTGTTNPPVEPTTPPAAPAPEETPAA